ncbi:MAG: hypothetical protein ACRDN0_20250 [Trebonia sp.]
MGYSPKHAKPASLKDAAQGSRRGLFSISEASTGRHSARAGDAHREPPPERSYTCQ